MDTSNKTAGFPQDVHVGQAEPDGGTAEEVRHPRDPALGHRHPPEGGRAVHAATVLEEIAGHHQVPQGSRVFPEAARREARGHLDGAVVPLVEGPEAVRVDEEGRESRQGVCIIPPPLPSPHVRDPSTTSAEPPSPSLPPPPPPQRIDPCEFSKTESTMFPGRGGPVGWWSCRLRDMM